LGDALRARATPGSLPLGYCFAMNQALRIPIAIFFVVFFWLIILVFWWNYFLGVALNRIFFG